jgi:hypothetical protein
VAGGTETIAVAPGAAIERGEPDAPAAAAKLDDLRRGDHVDVRVAAGGTAERVRATSRTINGKIGEFRPLTPTAMPMIRLDGETEPRVLDLNAPIHLRSGDIVPRTTVPSDIGLAPGDVVTLRAHPETGRVFEVWKR